MTAEHRGILGGSADVLREFKQRFQAVRPLVRERRLAEDRRGVARRRHRVAVRGQQLRPGHGRGRGCKKKADGSGGQSAEALGRGCGGFATKIHAVVNPLGHPVVIEVTGAQASDSPRLPGLIAGLKTEAVLADKGYDAESNREAIRSQGAEPCIPPKKNRLAVIEYDRHLYQERNTVERYFARIKQYRRVATRFDKKAANFIGFVWVASLGILLA